MSDFYDNHGNYEPVYKTGRLYHVRVFDIEWDTDDVDPKTFSLPSELTLSVTIGEDTGHWRVSDLVSDFLSDEYEFCHYDFEIEYLHEEEYEYRADEDVEDVSFD